MSIRPIITFKAGICEVDVSLPHFFYMISAGAQYSILTRRAAIQQAIQGEALTAIRIHLPLPSFRRW